MAMFHFRLKSDKKPNGTKISAVKHVEYINREGSFSHDEHWQKTNKFVGDCITTTQTANALDGLETLLYKTDDFGSIKNSAKGIEVTENASLTTLSIALMLAAQTMNNQPLIINGSPDFHKAILQTAFLANLPIAFADRLLQKEFERLKEKKIDDDKKFIANGGTIVTKRPNPKSAIAPTHAKTIEDATKNGLRLPTLSELPLVYSESKGSDMLLPLDESGELEEFAKDFYKHVRWDFSSEQTRLAKWTANKILENIAETMEQHSALSHVEYINREKAFAKRGGCIFHAHRLPKWAHDDPKKFFQAADKYEGKGNRRYMEIEFALPNELKTVEQYRQIIDAFIAKHLSDHYYAYAIHNKIGVMSDGQHHPHVHIMFSERMIDEVEQKKERAACNFFKYPARRKKDGSEPSFEERRKHGAPKNRNWSDKSFLMVLRADFAQIQNEVLEQNGFSIRVDHRTLQAQKEEAEKNGDTFLARLFSRIPEEYVGVISCKEDDDPKVERLKEFRSLRKQHFDLVMKMDAIAKEKEELETKEAVQISTTKAKNLTDSQDFISQKFLSQYQQELKAKMFTAVAEVNKWKRVIISFHDAEEQAKLEYMTKSERELWQKYFEILAQKKQLEEFLQTLKKPKETQKDALKAYNDLVAGVNSKIFSLLSAARLMKKSVVEIEKKLESPDCKKNIQLVAHQILQANLYAKKMLRRESDNLARAVDALQNEIFAQTLTDDNKNIYKTREVYDIIRRQYFGLKKEYERTLDLKFDLQKRIITPQRAFAMAKNIFVGGDLKRLRASIRQYKKDEQRLAQNIFAVDQSEKIFQSRDWSVESRSIFLQEKYLLTKQKTLLEIEKARLANLKLSIEQKQAELESLYQKPDALKKIELIAAGILRKNYKFVRRLEEIETRVKNLVQRKNHAKKQLDALKIQLTLDKPHTCYKVNYSDNSSGNSLAAIIADAILKEPQAAQLVARFGGDNLEMEKDWEMMSEFDKDEIIRKKIIREL